MWLLLKYSAEKKTVQTENTKKQTFGTKNNGVKHKPGINGEVGMKKMKQQQQQRGGCEQINSESNNSNNIGDNDTNKEIATKTMIQKQQQHGRCKQISKSGVRAIFVTTSVTAIMTRRQHYINLTPYNIR